MLSILTVGCEIESWDCGLLQAWDGREGIRRRRTLIGMRPWGRLLHLRRVVAKGEAIIRLRIIVGHLLASGAAEVLRVSQGRSCRQDIRQQAQLEEGQEAAALRWQET